MSDIATQQVGNTDVELTETACNIGGDVITGFNIRGALIFKNASVASITVTVTATGEDKFGLSTPTHDKEIVIPASESRGVGGDFFAKNFGNNVGSIALAYTDVTTLTVIPLNTAFK